MPAAPVTAMLPRAFSTSGRTMHVGANMCRRAKAAGSAPHHVAEPTDFGVVACLPG